MTDSAKKAARDYAVSKIPRLTLIKHWQCDPEYHTLEAAFLAGYAKGREEQREADLAIVERFCPANDGCMCVASGVRRAIRAQSQETKKPTQEGV